MFEQTTLKMRLKWYWAMRALKDPNYLSMGTNGWWTLINSIGPWNPEGRSIAVGVLLHHIQHFAIWGRCLGQPCHRSRQCSSPLPGSFACSVVLLKLWYHWGDLPNASVKLLDMDWWWILHLPSCHLCWMCHGHTRSENEQK